MLALLLIELCAIVKAEIRDEQFKKCFQDEMASLSRIEVHLSLQEAGDFFLAHPDESIERYYQKLDYKERADLRSAASSYTEATIDVIENNQCIGEPEYEVWIDKLAEDDADRRMFERSRQLAAVAFDIALFSSHKYEEL